MNEHKFPYKWTLKDAIFTKDKGKVFSCFSCGGGSTMGYKLAGFDVIGCNEIDPKMMACYIENHKPKYSFLEPIQTFKLRKDLPKELYNLDILDGSWPCSPFSGGGNRSKDWGKEKKFKEGQSLQILDTLCFDFIDLAKEIQPKIVFGENVKGLLESKAKSYVVEIYRAFDKAGYFVQHWLLDASKMGVPQERERVIFLAFRKDLAQQFLTVKDMFTVSPKIDLYFNEKRINFSYLQQYNIEREYIKPSYVKYFEKANHRGVYDERQNGHIKFGFFRKAMKNRPLATIMSGNVFSIEEQPLKLSTSELAMAQTYPLDYNYLDCEPQYLIGMSVPPVMTAQIATRIYEQWLCKLCPQHQPQHERKVK
jgi:DNA (cytosine-5)-methyltransferase 1